LEHTGLPTPWISTGKGIFLQGLRNSPFYTSGNISARHPADFYRLRNNDNQEGSGTRSPKSSPLTANPWCRLKPNSPDTEPISLGLWVADDLKSKGALDLLSTF
jgi:hypothetical protein